MRRNPVVRRHVARIAVMSLIGLGLVGISGAANADKPGDLLQPVTNPSADPGFCLPKAPIKLPVDLHACLKTGLGQQPSDDPSTDPSSSSPTQTQSDSGSDATSSDLGSDLGSDVNTLAHICVPVPQDVLDKMPLELIRALPKEVPTCIPACASDAVLRGLRALPEDTLNELIGEITKEVGAFPDCLLSVLPVGGSPENPPSQEPSTHRHHHHHLPPIPHHVPANLGPAAPIDESPDFTG